MKKTILQKLFLLPLAGLFLSAPAVTLAVDCDDPLTKAFLPECDGEVGNTDGDGGTIGEGGDGSGTTTDGGDAGDTGSTVPEDDEPLHGTAGDDPFGDSEPIGDTGTDSGNSSGDADGDLGGDSGDATGSDGDDLGDEDGGVESDTGDSTFVPFDSGNTADGGESASTSVNTTGTTSVNNTSSPSSGGALTNPGEPRYDKVFYADPALTNPDLRPEANPEIYAAQSPDAPSASAGALPSTGTPWFLILSFFALAVLFARGLLRSTRT